MQYVLQMLMFDPFYQFDWFITSDMKGEAIHLEPGIVYFQFLLAS